MAIGKLGILLRFLGIISAKFYEKYGNKTDVWPQSEPWKITGMADSVGPDEMAN